MPEDINIEMAVPTSSTAPKIIKGSKKPPPLLDTFISPALEPVAVKKAVLIYNPVSGGKKGKKLAEKVVAPMFKAAGVELVLAPTTHAGHAIALAAELGLSGVDALCALGGDGTLSDVASGFLSRSDAPDVALGFIPGGTGNTIMHDVLGYRPKMNGAAVRTAVRAILDGRTRRVDCSKFQCAGSEAGSTVHRHSLNIVTCGLGVVRLLLLLLLRPICPSHSPGRASHLQVTCPLHASHGLSDLSLLRVAAVRTRTLPPRSAAGWGPCATT
jgi:hypothetical protein